jgi:hypothetical protein
MTHRANFEIGNSGTTMDFLIETESGMIWHSGIEREVTPRSMGADFAAKLTHHQNGGFCADCVLCQDLILKTAKIMKEQIDVLARDFQDDPRDPAQIDADLFDAEMRETYAAILAR